MLFPCHHNSNWLIKFSEESDIKTSHCFSARWQIFGKGKEREKNEESSTRNKAISILLLNKSYIVSIDCRNGPFNKRHNVGIHFGRELSARFRSLHVKSSKLPVVSFISIISFMILLVTEFYFSIKWKSEGMAPMWRHAKNVPLEKFLYQFRLFNCYKKTVKAVLDLKKINKFWLVPEFTWKGSEISQCQQNVLRMWKAFLSKSLKFKPRISSLQSAEFSNIK